jgi:hypothetical protein
LRLTTTRAEGTARRATVVRRAGARRRDMLGAVYSSLCSWTMSCLLCPEQKRTGLKVMVKQVAGMDTLSGYGGAVIG